MATVPNVVGKSYDTASILLSRKSMGIRVRDTNPSGQAWEGDWDVDYQYQAAGTVVDPVPIGYMVGVILIMPTPILRNTDDETKEADYKEIGDTSN